VNKTKGKSGTAFVNAVAAEHGPRLRRFLHARVRNAADANDLVQEVYLRLLRVDDHETIRMPEAYVFALANHVLYQYRLKQSRSLEPAEMLEAMAEAQTAFENDPQVQSENQQRIEELENVLDHLSPKARATLIMHRRDGLTLEQIGAKLGISRPMVKKYLAKALIRCRQALKEEE
jgi:RNA polymerase sigma factor (sigma-70 family)